MIIEEQIDALIAEAEPLRSMPEGQQGDLAAIIDEINLLRAVQAARAMAVAAAKSLAEPETLAVVEGADAAPDDDAIADEPAPEAATPAPTKRKYTKRAAA